MKPRQFDLPDEAATRLLGASIARSCPLTLSIHLHGELGAGKTTLVQGFMAALGYCGRVRSPTYTLVETYTLHGCEICHFDLYRLGGPEELEYLGVRDYLGQSAIWLVEWPQRGQGVLPRADLEVVLEYREQGRGASLTAVETAQAVIDSWSLRAPFNQTSWGALF